MSIFERRIYVHLKGGLGNQLFQYSAGQYYASKSKSRVILDLTTGNPRINSKGKVELLDIVDSSIEKLENKKQIDSFIGRVVNFSLRINLRKKSKFNVLLSVALKVLASVVLSLRHRHIMQAIVSDNLGWVQSNPRKISTYLIGYFQSTNYVCDENLIRQLKSGLNRQQNQITKELEQIADEKKILAVHVRLTDYTLEKDFGILTKDYYRRALSKFNLEDFDQIWIFSDDFKHAMEYLPRDYRHKYVKMDYSELSSTQNLLIMSMADAFIIANSTFSWWGARLARAESAFVIAPNPWFKNLDSPNQLIPTEWTLEDR